MRADARANRDEIVEAALELFQEQADFNVSFRTIASRAGVGVATLHRHFPDRAALITEVIDHLDRGVTAIIEDHLSRWDEDPQRAWSGSIHRLVDLGIAPLASGGSEFAVTEGKVDGFLQYMRQKDMRPMERLLGKGVQHGFAPSDLDPYRFAAGIVLLSRPLPYLTAQILPDQREWLVDVYIDGLRARARDTSSG